MSITKKQLAYLEELFADYESYDKKISLRKAELKIKEIDENVGGGRSSDVGRPVETQIICEMSDERLRFLERCKKGVEFTLNYFDEDVSQVIQSKFFENHGMLTWEEVAGKVFRGRTSVYRIRYMVLEVFGNYIGLLNTLDFK